MNEATKTGTFFAVGMAMLAIGLFVSWETPIQLNNKQSLVNQPLFPDFKDPLVAASVKIVTFNKDQGSFKDFEVRRNQTNGAWSITSHKGYPADAVEQMQNAANSLIDLTILEEFTVDPSEHAQYGVVEPNEAEYTVGDEGLGRLVTFKDGSQKTLASMVLGNRVEPGSDKIYVRVPGQDPVYVVSLDDRPLSTNFQDWIETDLLKLSSIGVERLRLQDYSTVPQQQQGQQQIVFAISRNYEATLSRDLAQWKIDQLREFDPADQQSEGMVVKAQTGKEPNMTNVGNLLNSLDDMQIVDVVRKPEGVSEHLKSDKELLSDNAVLNSLVSLGFYPVSDLEGTRRLSSANGELTVKMDDGVEYALRFGKISGLGDQSGAKANDTGDGTESRAGLNRYLFVTVQVDEGHFPPPELKALPQNLDELEDDAKPEDGISDEEKQEFLEAAQEKVRKENQRKLDERKDLMKVAQRRADELNERFADWYYVIPEDTYSKLKIKQADLIQE